MRPTLIAISLCLFVLAATGAREAPITVSRGDIVTEMEFAGTVAPGRFTEVKLTPLQWRGKWLLEHVVAAGSVVREGDVVLRFGTRELTRDLESSRLSLDWSEREHAIAAKRREMNATTALQSLERQEFALRSGRRNLIAYRDVALVNARVRAELDEAGTRFGLANAREELAQLLKMYEEDELLDDTEQIVLERARWDVKNREARLELRLKQRSYTIEFEEKVRLEALVREVSKLERELARAREEAKLAKAGRAIEDERARRALSVRTRKHREMAADLEAMTVRAPTSGILLHGPAVGAGERRFALGTQPDFAVAVATIAEPGGLVAVFDVPASRALLLEPGLQMLVAPDAAGATSAKGKVQSISALPKKGTFRVVVEFEHALESRFLGISCKAHGAIRAARNVLVVPLAVIVIEGDKTFVTVGDPTGTGERRVKVRLGARDEKMVEVQHGLAEGDALVMPEKGR